MKSRIRLLVAIGLIAFLLLMTAYITFLVYLNFVIVDAFSSNIVLTASVIGDVSPLILGLATVIAVLVQWNVTKHKEWYNPLFTKADEVALMIATDIENRETQLKLYANSPIYEIYFYCLDSRQKPYLLIYKQVAFSPEGKCLEIHINNDSYDNILGKEVGFNMGMIFSQSGIVWHRKPNGILERMPKKFNPVKTFELESIHERSRRSHKFII